jgi:hypothetical protein
MPKAAPQFKLTHQERKDLVECICSNIAIIRVKANTFNEDLNKLEKNKINRLLSLNYKLFP